MRANLFVAVFFFFASVIFPVNVSAHSIGQPPFFKVNGKYSPLYNVPTTSLADFPLPQDGGPENYMVNKPVEFEIDQTQLQVPLDIFQKTIFTWDMGDGTSKTGSKVSYEYTKPGSYLIKINAEYEKTSGAQLFQSILINILPDENYKLPKAVLAVNNKTPADPLIDLINFKFGQELQFDASKSTGKIAEYFWDFGDTKSAFGKEVKHTYSTDLTQQQVFPVLRVKDENGFIADTFAEVDNKGGGANVSKVSNVSKGSKETNVQVVGTVLVLFVVLVGGLLLRKKRGHN